MSTQEKVKLGHATLLFSKILAAAGSDLNLITAYQGSLEGASDLPHIPLAHKKDVLVGNIFDYASGKRAYRTEAGLLADLFYQVVMPLKARDLAAFEAGLDYFEDNIDVFSPNQEGWHTIIDQERLELEEAAPSPTPSV